MSNKQRVLLIDDEPYVIEILAAELKDRSIDFISAMDGATALALIEKEKPSVIVSDYKMPGLDGIELLRFLRNLQINTPVIWMTGNADDKTMSDAWRLGVYHLFQKPFDPEMVANEISKALSETPEFWLEFKPNYLTEKMMDRFAKKIQIDVEMDIYEGVKRHCLNNSISFNTFINNLLRKTIS